MHGQKLFLFDFDGVIVDGMNEYWHSSLLACEKFLNSKNILIQKDLYNDVPNIFKEIRPWVKYGWEMVIITHEIIKKENPLTNTNQINFIDKYHQNCQKFLQNNSWTAENLQQFLDESRKYQIEKDFELWINLHKPFYEVIYFIKQLKQRNIKTGIITTKGKTFATKILSKLNIFPELIFGYESGTKVEIAENLLKKYEIVGFLEDRVKTLINIKNTKGTKNIPCYLADWGYLKSSDRKNLIDEIKLVKLKKLEDMLAN